MLDDGIKEYVDLWREMEPFIEENGLDKVAVNSLLRSSMEFLKPGPSRAAVVLMDAKDLSSSASVKLVIRVDMKLALESIFCFRSVLEERGIWLMLALLRAISLLIADARVDFGKKETIVLFALYRLRSADVREITAYIDRLIHEEENIHIESDIDVKGALKNLEAAGTVKMDYGKFRMCETVLIKNG